ncbi:SCO3242 family prenyltransferase [Dactylosporangium sp. NPDC000521]|uniref:SCO3242 family prenyltransferase n=1 Tax=Dactylosporangium sp. NPDC000521 TaxID=3363975 RepID=UPI00368B50B3
MNTGRPDWRTLAELVRAPAALSVPGDVVAGAAAAGTLGPRTPVLAGSSVLLYWAGMAANDWADRDLDATERPERPIPSGRVTPGAAFGVAAGLTAAGVGLAGLAGGRRALAVAVPLAGAVWAYDLKLKNTPAGPAAMAACRALDVLLGASGGRLRSAVYPAATVFAHTYTVTALSRAEVHGSTPALPAATLAGSAAVAVSAALPSRPVGRWSWIPAALSGWYAKRYGEAQLKALEKPTASNIRASVGAGIVNLPTLQGALTARAGAPLAGIAVAAAAPLGRRLAKWLSPT